MVPPHFKSAIARISVQWLPGEAFRFRGTGFLAAPRRLLTALHVVAGEFGGLAQAIKAEFQFEDQLFETICTVMVDDHESDFALLECQAPPDVLPIPLVGLHALHAPKEWSAFGYPATTEQTIRNGQSHTGVFSDTHHRFGKNRVPVYGLFCREAAAGDGQPVKGLSGSPCLCGVGAVGLLRSALLVTNAKDGDEHDRCVAGTLFASPITEIVKRCPTALSLLPALPFEGEMEGELRPMPVTALFNTASHMRIAHHQDMGASMLSHTISRDLLGGKPVRSAGALQTLWPHLKEGVTSELVEMVGSKWVHGDPVAVLESAFLPGNPVAFVLNGRDQTTARMYLLRASRRLANCRNVRVASLQGSVEEIMEELEHALTQELNCDRSELDDELATYWSDYRIPLVIILTFPANLPDVVEHIRDRLGYPGIFLLWLTGHSLPAVRSFEGMRPLLPPLDEGQEETALRDHQRGMDALRRTPK